MSFGDEIFRALTGRSHGHTSFGARLEAIVADAGSGRKAAKLLGVAESTLRGWRKGSGGRSARGAAAREARLDRLYRAAIARPDALDRWRHNRMTVTVVGVPGRTQNTRELNSTSLDLAPGTGQRVVDAFLAGDDAGAARAFKAGIRNEWYHDTLFGEWMDDDDLRGEEDHYDDAKDYGCAVGGAA